MAPKTFRKEDKKEKKIKKRGSTKTPPFWG